MWIALSQDQLLYEPAASHASISTAPVGGMSALEAEALALLALLLLPQPARPKEMKPVSRAVPRVVSAERICGRVM